MTFRSPALDPLHLKASGVRSPVFQGDALVDWVGGGRVFGFDGSEQRSRKRRF